MERETIDEQPKYNPRKSTMACLKKLTHRQSAHRAVIDTLSHDEFASSVSLSSNPVNILILEGGGQKGQAHFGMLQGLADLDSEHVISCSILI